MFFAQNLRPISDSNEVLKKIKSTSPLNKVVVKRGDGGIASRLETINTLVDKEFKDKSHYLLINTNEKLVEYFNAIIENGDCGFDTETSGLDTYTCDLAGISVYTLNQKPAYIPINHISCITFEKVSNQIEESFVKSQLSRLIEHDVKLIIHNAKFDIKVIKHCLGIHLGSQVYWDSMIASQLLNENEPHGLKPLCDKYVYEGDEKSLVYSDLFKGIPFTIVPIKSGYLYAAKDAKMHYDLYKYQEQYLDERFELCKEKGLQKLARLFRNVEMPLITTLVELEDNGVVIDKEYATKLSVEYHAELEEREKTFYKALKPYHEKIEQYKRKNYKNKLSDPININSPEQIAVVLYDILELISPDKLKLRSTEASILDRLEHPLIKPIINCRETLKLLSTYIDALPNAVKSDGKAHTNMNQNGAGTGRLSSSDYNSQNIPTKGRHKRIRNMFKGSQGSLISSSDYSKNEPAILAEFSADEELKKAFEEGKDVYSFMGSKTYKIPYEDCLEFYTDGTVNKEGKKRRTAMKETVLGLMYGKQAKAIAEALKISEKEATRVMEAFFSSFPKVKEWIDALLIEAKKTGYVETLWGRKRRLPDLTLPEYEFEYTGENRTDFDPLDFTQTVKNEVSFDKIKYYWKKFNKSTYWKEIKIIMKEAENEGISVKANTRLINDAERQAMNAPMQGSAADMIKYAMVKVDEYSYYSRKSVKAFQLHKDKKKDDELFKLSEEFFNLGGKILLQVHDELLIEAPKATIFRCTGILKEIMIKAASHMLKIPMKVDSHISECWAGEAILETV